MGKIKIIYYSCSGLTRIVAEKIHEVTGGELCEIILERPYNKLTAYTRGVIDTRRGNITNIKNKIDVSDADTIYLGSPIWAWTISSALNSYLKNNSLSGKKIIPFCTHGGNYGDYFEKIKELTPNCKYGEGHDFSFVNKKSDMEILEEVKQWIFVEEN